MNDQSADRHNLQGQVAVVTGAAQGLGLAMGERLARDGATVVMADLQQEKMQAEADRLKQTGLNVHPASLDVADSTGVKVFFDNIVSQHGSLDVLVNNAGVGQTVTPTVDLSDDEWHRVMNITLNGTFYCCRAGGAIMERQESGSIVNISSINGQNPAALVAAYNVAKAGVIMLTRTLSLELAAYGVRVNAVCPGPVYTDFNKSVMDQRRQSLDISMDEMVSRIEKAVPLGRWGEAEDIANGVAFLCSPASSWITGEVLRVSGGLEGVAAAPPKRTKS
ncbi:MAG: SDR family NAD(P)-dependent oxidoreductase [Planctomycetaceae bacterium]|jgi:NAD(P)-dependent dehydrogenase (short-subunit alcohol dehydrogenase family)